MIKMPRFTLYGLGIQVALISLFASIRAEAAMETETVISEATEFSIRDDGDPGNWESLLKDADDTLAGVIKYPGGYVPSAEVKVSSPQVVKYFRVAIPGFCKDVEILEASTVTEGVKDVAKLIDKKALLFSINSGAGQRISAIQLILNGPEDKTCSIPIYLRSKPMGPGEDPQGVPEIDPLGKLQICNRDYAALRASVGYHDGHQWVTEGWWQVGPGRCVGPKTQSPLLGNIYVHAVGASGKIWGNGSSFCVKRTHFKATDASCTKAGYYWEAFSKFKFSGETQLLVTLVP